MSEGWEAARRPARAPLRRRRGRRRWVLAGGAAACWLALEIMTGSVVSATVVLVVIAVLAGAGVAGLRALGVTRDHPWIRQIASRPWRDGQDVLQIAMRHLSDAFVIMPNGSLLAPNVLELQLNPEDFRSVCERMEPGVLSASMTEAYESQVAAHGARFAGPDRADVYVIGDDSVPPGRYSLRQGHPVTVGAQPDRSDARYEYAPPEMAHTSWQPVAAGSGGYAWQESGPGSAISDGRATVMERTVAPVPVLRLITGSSVAETLMSGARAGRGSVELMLPDVPTVSREHARFTFRDGRWWIINQGMNGLALNGVPVTQEQPVSAGDAIRWGTRPDALMSRVEIGSGHEVRHLLSRHGETGWPGCRRAVAPGLRLSGDGTAFPVVRRWR
jgi:FHA domain